MHFFLRFLLAALLVGGAPFLAAPASAQAAAPEVRVATRALPPIVIENGSGLSGFSVDLWTALATRLRVRTVWQVAPDVGALLELVRAGQADLGISAISITAARETVLDFSQPILTSGLEIMVRGSGPESGAASLLRLAAEVVSPAGLLWLGMGLLLILVPAHLVWLFERRDPESTIPSPYFPGIFHATFWSASTLAAAGEMPHQWLARILAVIWIFAGVNLLAFYTAHLTATLTVQQVMGDISGPDDLRGRLVATTAGSTAAAAVRDLRGDVVEVTRIEDAFDKLRAGEVDAVVFDAPILRYYAANDGKHHVHIVGDLFHAEDYGIAFPLESPWRKRVNAALLQMREDGTYQRLYDKWFVDGE
jgi:polar amino acid transport system substrate-binding protein